MVRKCIQEPIREGQTTKTESIPVVIASDQPAIPVTTTIVGVATEVTAAAILTAVDQVETKLDTIDGHIDQIEGYVDGIEGSLTTISGNVSDIETGVNSLLNKMGAAAFTLTYDQLAFTYNANQDIITSKLLGSDRQVLTITYSDATKQTITNVGIVTLA